MNHINQRNQWFNQRNQWSKVTIRYRKYSESCMK
jgi:hypothetical protein